MRLKLIAVVAIFVVGAMGVYYGHGDLFGFRYWGWHQKISVSVQTPQGQITRSSVLATSWEMPPYWFKLGDSGGWHGVGNNVLGEAVPIPIAPNKYLFVLAGGLTPDTTIKLFAPLPLQTDHPDEYKRALDQIAATVDTKTLSEEQYPRLVVFSDINDPTTARFIKPIELAGFFGPGVALNSMSLSLTKEKVTDGPIDDALPWLCKLEFKLSAEIFKPHQDKLAVYPTELKSDRCRWRDYVMQLWGTDTDDKIESRLCCP